MSRLSRLFEIGIINTIKLNFHYFSFRDAIRFPVLASKRLRIKKMDGAISLGTIKTGIVTLGFDSVGLFDAKKDRSILEIGKDAHLEFQGKARLGNGFKIILIEQGHLTIGSGFILTANSSIVCCDHIMIGSNSLFSWDILIMDTDFHRIYDMKKEILNNPRPITIGERVWVGCRATILKGSNVPDGSIIASGALVAGDLKEINGMYGGVPAKLLRSGVKWKL